MRWLPDHGRGALALPVEEGAGRDASRGLKEGKVDIVIGTHRLLSKDVHFKDLGLLVVDEEQRFGVTHKERIKQLRTNVDVLTLSRHADPAHAADGGQRPARPVAHHDAAGRSPRHPHLRHRATTNLVRGGHRARARARRAGLLRLQPRRGHLRASRSASRRSCPRRASPSAHGQMSEAPSSRRCSTSSRAATTSSCATAIIESGLDIPRANTILIDRADIFGLAQLYQLRGRVGRCERARVLLPDRAAAERDDRRGARAHRGARAPHRARVRLPDRVARSRAARRGRSARRRAERATSRGRLRPVLPDARRGRRTSSAASPSSTRSIPSSRSTSRRCFPTTTSPTSACGSPSTSGSRAPRTKARWPSSATEMEDRFGTAAGRGPAPRRADAAQDRASPAQGARSARRPAAP